MKPMADKPLYSKFSCEEKSWLMSETISEKSNFLKWPGLVIFFRPLRDDSPDIPCSTHKDYKTLSKLVKCACIDANILLQN